MSAIVPRVSFFDDFFDDFKPGFFIKPLHGEPLPSPSQIKIDVKESNGQFIVNAEVPGIAKEDIEVSVDGSVVTLRAEIKQSDEQVKDSKVLRSERYFGEVSRSFQLPCDLDESKAKAKYDKGILTLSLPKKVSTSSQRLAIE
jgi:HSP20 family protein